MEEYDTDVRRSRLSSFLKIAFCSLLAGLIIGLSVGYTLVKSKGSSASLRNADSSGTATSDTVTSDSTLGEDTLTSIKSYSDSFPVYATVVSTQAVSTMYEQRSYVHIVITGPTLYPSDADKFTFSYNLDKPLSKDMIIRRPCDETLLGLLKAGDRIIVQASMSSDGTLQCYNRPITITTDVLNRIQEIVNDSLEV